MTMICAYDELYLNSAQRILGDMYDHSVNTLKFDLNEFHKMFIISGISNQVEIGNPAYIAGKNGCEVVREVIHDCTDRLIDTEDIMYLDKSPEYWAGWSLAYYQWTSCLTFREINNHMPIDKICGMYDALHEADISLFVEIMDEQCRNHAEGS